MKQALERVGLPVVSLELIAGVAAVNQVNWLIGAALGARLKVIHGQLGANIALLNPAIAAAKTVLLPKRLPLRAVHLGGAALPLRMRVCSSSIACRSALASARVCSSRRARASFRRTRL